MQREVEKIGLCKGKSIVSILSIVFFLTLLIPFSLAITSTNYHSNVTSITSGGTTIASLNYELLTAIGDIIGSISSTNYITSLGFIYSSLTVTQVIAEEEEEEEEIPRVSYRGSTGPALPSKREFAIQPGLMVLTNFPYGSALESIKTNVLFAGENAKLIAHELPKVNVPKINAYTFLEILAFNIYFDKAEITFKVDNNWIISNNIEEDSITLMLFGNMWIPLTTEKTYSSQGYTYFKTETSRFGLFGVTGQTKLFEPVKEIEETIPAISEITPSITKEIPKKEIIQILNKIKEQKIVYIIASSIIIIGLIILILILLIHKKEERKLKKIRRLISLGKFEKAEKLYRNISKQGDIEYSLTEYKIQKENKERQFRGFLEAAEKRIKQAIENGYTKKQIIKAFLQKDWDKKVTKVIKSLLSEYLKEKAEKESYYNSYDKEDDLNKPKKGFKFSKILLILLLTLLVSSGIFFLLKGGIGNISSWVDKGESLITGFVVYNPETNDLGDNKNQSGSYNETLVYEVNEGTTTFQTLATTNIPKKINIQGKLTDSSGNVLSGSYTFVFSIYNAYSDGDKLWTEDQSIAVSKGIYDAALGSVNALNLSFADPYYLGITVSGDSEMIPRINLSTNPYAFRANFSDYNLPISGGNLSGTLYSQNISTDSDNTYHLGTSFFRWAKGWFNDLRIDGKITSDDTVFIDDDVNVSGNLNVTGDLEVEGNITLTGTTDAVLWNNGTHLRIGT